MFVLMETIKDFFQSLIDSYRERIKSPLIGSFALSFIIYNWRPISILFWSNWPIHKRIAWIDKIYCKWESLVWPLVIALFYILILPYINLFFEWILERYSNKKFIKKGLLRLSNLKQQKEEAILKREIADAEAGTSEINNLKQRNDSLLKDIDLLTEQYKTDEARNNSLLEKLKKSEELMKLEIKKSEKDAQNSLEALNAFRFNPRFLELPARTMSLIDQLNIQDRLYFLDFCNSQVYQTLKSQIAIDDEKIVKFLNLGLITPPSPVTKSHDLTQIGTIVYAYLDKELNQDVPF